MVRISPVRSIGPRIRARSDCAAGALLAAAVLLTLTQQGLAQDEPTDTPNGSAVYGSVVDRSTGDPVQGAEVRLQPVGGGGVSVRTTDDSGRFVLPRHPMGEYVIAFERFGYEPATDSVRLAVGSDVQLTVELAPAALQMEPVVVQTVRRSRLVSAGFYRRREMGIGRFLTRSDIEERRPYQATDLFRSMPGVRVTPGTLGRGAQLRLRGGCQPDLYIDGVRAVSSDYIDEILQPQDLEAVEVYHVGQTPARFRVESCGVVAAWTRAPEVAQNGGSFWKRLLAAGVFAALAIILTR